MQRIYRFKLMTGAHHDQASGNTYACTPDKRVPAKPEAEDQTPTIIPGAQPVFESAMELDKVFRNKFQRVPDDTPTTNPPDASALAAKARNEKELSATRTPANESKKGNRKN
jgi:hypothetical protein